MARNTDPKLLMHSRIVETLEQRLKEAQVNQSSDEFIELIEKDLDLHKAALGQKTN